MTVKATGASGVLHEFTELEYRMSQGWLNRIKRAFGAKMKREPVLRDVYTGPIDEIPVISLYAKILDTKVKHGEILAPRFSENAKKVAKGYGIKLLLITQSEAQRRFAVSRGYFTSLSNYA